ncbi:MAG TPA: hypothetical protein VNZ64_08990 [Candidatus Acidoferrum sp.]|jgi:hypothetical protein|nr:hypothetical protein [Candidatus Acidoferrum sp.]
MKRNSGVAQVRNVVRLTVPAFQALVPWNKATGPGLFTGTEKIFLPRNETAGVIFCLQHRCQIDWHKAE